MRFDSETETLTYTAWRRKELSLFLEADKAKPARLTPEQKPICKTLITQAKDAIERGNLLDLRLSLGAGVYPWWSEFYRKTRKLHNQWLTCQIKLVILKRKEDVLLAFAKAHGFPRKISGSQRADLQNHLEKVLKEELEIPDFWQIKEDFLPEVKAHANKLLEKSRQKLTEQFRELRLAFLPIALGSIEEERNKLLSEIEEYESKQEQMTEDYKTRKNAVANNFEGMWEIFKSNRKKDLEDSNLETKILDETNTLDARLLALKEAGIANVSLNEEDLLIEEANGEQTLIDYAIKCYHARLATLEERLSEIEELSKKASRQEKEQLETEKKALKIEKANFESILAFLLQHGSRPSQNIELSENVRKIITSYHDPVLEEDDQPQENLGPKIHKEPAEQEREKQRQEQERRERALQSYVKLRRKEFPPSFLIASEEKPKPLTQEQWQDCRALVLEAKKAIDMKDLERLHLALGPRLYTQWSNFYRSTQKNHHEWLQCHIELVILQRKKDVLLRFARENKFPDQVKDEWQQSLSQQLEDALNQEFVIPESWQIKDENAFMERQHPRRLLNQECKRLEQDPIKYLRREFDKIIRKCNALLKKIKKYEEQQDELNKEWASYNVEDLWGEFERERNENSRLLPRDLKEKIAQLKTAGIASISLDEENIRIESSTGPETLFDYAVKYYNAMKEDAEREQFRPFLEALLQHGSGPSKTDQTKLKPERPLLAMIAQYTIPGTHFCDESLTGLSSYLQEAPKRLHISRITAERLRFVQGALSLLWKPTREPIKGRNLANYEREVLEYFQRGEASASIVSSSTLFTRHLPRIRKKHENGEMISCDPLPLKQQGGLTEWTIGDSRRQAKPDYKRLGH